MLIPDTNCSTELCKDLKGDKLVLRILTAKEILIDIDILLLHKFRICHLRMKKLSSISQ